MAHTFICKIMYMNWVYEKKILELQAFTNIQIHRNNLELSQGLGCQMMSFFVLFIPKTKVIKIVYYNEENQIKQFLGLVKNGIFIFTKKTPKNKNKKPPRWPSTYLLLGLSLLILYMKVKFCFSGSFYWKHWNMLFRLRKKKYVIGQQSPCGK